MQKTDCFKIQLLKFAEGEDIFDIKNGVSILRKNADNRYCALNPTIIEADPFLFVKDKTLYLFYETKRLRNFGVLAMVSTKDLTNWTDPVVVLQESFHLSFPWVFEDSGHVYMVPETSSTDSIRLYEATNNDLSSFRFVKTLLEKPSCRNVEMGYSDTCITKKDNLFYMFTQLQYKDKINTLELYVSDSLTGNYLPHPMSPIIHSQKTGRNAGSIMNYNNKLLRFAQDCTSHYGDNVHVLEITKLNPTEYREILFRESILPNDGFYCNGGHQFNAVLFNNQWIVATDAKDYPLLFFQRLLSRVIRKTEEFIHKFFS